MSESFDELNSKYAFVNIKKVLEDKNLTSFNYFAAKEYQSNTMIDLSEMIAALPDQFIFDAVEHCDIEKYPDLTQLFLFAILLHTVEYGMIPTDSLALQQMLNRTMLIVTVESLHRKGTCKVFRENYSVAFDQPNKIAELIETQNSATLKYDLPDASKE